MKINLRKVIISLIGIALIALGYFGKEKMASREKPERPKEVRALPTVFTTTIKNQDTPIKVTASGNLQARDRIEIFSEVQGVFDFSSNSFKPGVYFENGSTLLRLNSDEYRANLRAQKSNLYNQIVTILPDLRFDYPNEYQKWEEYVNSFDVNQNLKVLPEITSEKEKLFISSRNINSTWYNVKNAEERLAKYTIYAPYNGVLTEANIDKGALVRAGQKLGEFINPYVYELEVAVNSSYVDFLKVGNSVELSDIEKTNRWKGKVNRLNSLIDPATQTVQAYITVTGKGLREGMYLEADLTAENKKNTFEISRKLLVENSKLYGLEGNVLTLLEIEPVYFTERTVVARGLEDGTEILERMLPGAYEGMTVKRYEE